MYYPPETQVTPLTSIRRERVLPAPGEILVQAGDWVDPMQVVARVDLPGDFRIVSIARLLDVPVAKAKRYFMVKPGDEVERGQMIARKGRLLGRSVRSPISGQVTASGGGRLLIEAPSTLFELLAYIGGKVANVLDPHGLIVETTGAVIQGVWGGGGGSSGENLGVIRCVAENPDDLLTAEAVDLSHQGMILAGGIAADKDAFEQAREFQVRGIVVGGLLPELLSYVEELPFPVVVIEGIGAIPMSGPAFDLLQTNDGREASISGRFQTRWPVIRPEIVIPLHAESLPPSQAQAGMPLTVGAQVRIVRAPYTGATGTVVALPSQRRRTETGAEVYGAEVTLGQGPSVFVPLTNLEVLR
jgi:hypothetical protein